MRLHAKRYVQAVAALLTIYLLLSWLGFLGDDDRFRKLVIPSDGFELHRGGGVLAPPLSWGPESIFWDNTSGIIRPTNTPVGILYTRAEILDGVPSTQISIANKPSFITENQSEKTAGLAGLLPEAIAAGVLNVIGGGESSKLFDSGSNTFYNLNIRLSDTIPLNRDVPDSRPKRCGLLEHGYPKNLPTTSVVITLHNEWPSVIVRTVYSIINRTPAHLLKEIILVDDASTTELVKSRLKNYLKWSFSKKLVKLVRMKSRQGLIRSRLEGLRHVTGEVVAFFDSHMEVNRYWLEPLLVEIVKNKKTVALSQLDYINKDTFKYEFYPGYRTRYGFRWDMAFFETFFRPDQLANKQDIDPLPAVLFVGTGFAVDVSYFKAIGSYDPGMMIWGGENIEFAWRVWMCGGKILHVPCSRIGHIERSQPYAFPKGRLKTEMYNYKRAVDVWLGDYKDYVYAHFPGMVSLDVGSLDERHKLREKLGCHNFSWFIDNIWPELLRYKEDGEIWGMVKSQSTKLCLDNDDFVFQGPHPVVMRACAHDLNVQGFALSPSGQLKTTIHCVIAKAKDADLLPFVENCFLRPPQKWKYTEKQQLLHVPSGMCLQALGMSGLVGAVVLQPCLSDKISQKWTFESENMMRIS